MENFIVNNEVWFFSQLPFHCDVRLADGFLRTFVEVHALLDRRTDLDTVWVVGEMDGWTGSLVNPTLL